MSHLLLPLRTPSSRSPPPCRRSFAFAPCQTRTTVYLQKCNWHGQPALQNQASALSPRQTSDGLLLNQIEHTLARYCQKLIAAAHQPTSALGSQLHARPTRHACESTCSGGRG
eukprot:3544416-Pleurochrysis_carterae.AAC.1